MFCYFNKNLLTRCRTYALVIYSGSEFNDIYDIKEENEYVFSYKLKKSWKLLFKN